MTERSGSFEKFLSTATTLDPPTDKQTINEMKHIVENSINGKEKSEATYTQFKKSYPDAPLAKLNEEDFIMVIRLMNDPKGANTIFEREGITWKKYYQKKLDAVKGGSKRKRNKSNKSSKRNKTLRGGKSKRKKPTNK